MDELEKQILEYIISQSGRQVENYYSPTIQEMGSRDINRLCGRDNPHQGCLEILPGQDGAAATANLYYEQRLNEFALNALLVHELAHWYDYLESFYKNYSCPQESERFAYEMSNAYVDQFGNPGQKRRYMLNQSQIDEDAQCR